MHAGTSMHSLTCSSSFCYPGRRGGKSISVPVCMYFILVSIIYTKQRIPGTPFFFVRMRARKKKRARR